MNESVDSSLAMKSPRLRVALIARDGSGRVLLLEHVREHGRYWVLPGGGVDPGETLENALIREIWEELGTGCDLAGISAIGELITPERHVVDFFYAGKMKHYGPYDVKHSEGIAEARWFKNSEIANLNLLPEEIKKWITKDDYNQESRYHYLGRYNLE